MNLTNREKSGRRPRTVQRLSDLSLDDGDIVALRRQGSVCREQRGLETYYKLRFRSVSGQQRVRYLGKDPITAEKIRQELGSLQFMRRRSQALVRSDANARKLLREVKAKSCSTLEELGFHYHGFQIRKRRAGV